MEKLECCYCHLLAVPADARRLRNVQAGRAVFCGRGCAARYHSEHYRRTTGAEAWETGKYQRRYTALLDPHYYDQDEFAQQWKEVFAHV